MKTIMIILGMTIMIKIQAIEQKQIDAYSTFNGVIGQITLLSTKQNVIPATKDEISALIEGWIKENVRKKSLDLLAKNGFDITQTKKIVIIEWGGGGIPYRALYLSEKMFFIRTSDDGNLSIHRIGFNKNIFQDVSKIQGLIEKNNYAGNVSKFGFDFPTYIITILDDTGGQKKVAIIYGASVANIKDKKDMTDNENHTISIWNLIMKIKKSCDIKQESGA